MPRSTFGRLAVSTLATAMLLTAALLGSSTQFAFAGATWGNFEGELMTLPSSATVVSLEKASGGLAARLRGGEANTTLYADPIRDAGTTVIAVRARRADACGGEAPRLTLVVDGQALQTYSVTNSAFTYKMIPLPDEMIASFLGRTHDIAVRMPDSGTHCARFIDVDMGGFWSIGMLHAAELVVHDNTGALLPASATTWSRETRSRDGERVDTLVLRGAVRASGTMAEAADWGNQLRVISSGTQCDGIWPTIRVRIDGTIIGSRAINHSKFGAEQFALPEGLEGPRDVTVELVNPTSPSGCRRTASIEWLHGASTS